MLINTSEVAIISSLGRILIFDRQNGNIKREFLMQQGNAIDPIIKQNKIYFIFNNGIFSAYNLMDLVDQKIGEI